MEETWKTVPGFEDYEVSNHGNIRSKERLKKYKSGRTMQPKSKLKKQRPHPVNHFMMTDLIDNNGKRKTVYPHKAVAQAFIKKDMPRKQKVVLHIDGDLANNKVDNLKWATYSESIQLGFETGKRDNSDLWEKRRAKYGPMGGTKPMGRPDPLDEKQKQEIYLLRTEKKMSYQAVIRDASDNLITDTQIGMQISILQGSASGTAVYVETQEPITNTNGLVSLK